MAIKNIMKIINGKVMKTYKYRVVADKCPLKRKNCNACSYNNGFDFNMKTYCGYRNKEFKEVWGITKKKQQ